jgi:hypothetical protein
VPQVVPDKAPNPGASQRPMEAPANIHPLMPGLARKDYIRIYAARQLLQRRAQGMAHRNLAALAILAAQDPQDAVSKVELWPDKPEHFPTPKPRLQRWDQHRPETVIRHGQQAPHPLLRQVAQPPVVGAQRTYMRDRIVSRLPLGHGLLEHVMEELCLSVHRCGFAFGGTRGEVFIHHERRDGFQLVGAEHRLQALHAALCRREAFMMGPGPRQMQGGQLIKGTARHLPLVKILAPGNLHLALIWPDPLPLAPAVHING